MYKLKDFSLKNEIKINIIILFLATIISYIIYTKNDFSISFSICCFIGVGITILSRYLYIITTIICNYLKTKIALIKR